MILRPIVERQLWPAERPVRFAAGRIGNKKSEQLNEGMGRIFGPSTGVPCGGPNCGFLKKNTYIGTQL